MWNRMTESMNESMWEECEHGFGRCIRMKFNFTKLSNKAEQDDTSFVSHLVLITKQKMKMTLIHVLDLRNLNYSLSYVFINDP